MQRRVGQHQAQRALMGRDAIRNAYYVMRKGETIEQDDGRLGRGEQFRFCRRDFAHGAGVFEGGDHHGEGFVRTAFALAQPLHRLGVGGITGQLEAAQALDGKDFTRKQAPDSDRQYVVLRIA